MTPELHVKLNGKTDWTPIPPGAVPDQVNVWYEFARIVPADQVIIPEFTLTSQPGGAAAVTEENEDAFRVI